MGTRPMISDLKSESHLHSATIIKGMATTKAYIHIKLVHGGIMNHFHSPLMRACDYCWMGGGGGGRRHPICYIIISHKFGCKWVKYSILWSTLSKFVYLDLLSHCVHKQNQIMCFKPLFKYDRF